MLTFSACEMLRESVPPSVGVEARETVTLSAVASLTCEAISLVTSLPDNILEQEDRNSAPSDASIAARAL